MEVFPMVKVLEELKSTELLPVAPWLMICSFQLIEKLLRGELGLSTMSVAPVSNKKRSVSLSFTRQCMYTRLSFPNSKGMLSITCAWANKMDRHSVNSTSINDFMILV